MFIHNIQTFPDFDSAARGVIEFLYQRLGFDLWMVTRTEGEDWIVLQAHDEGYGVKEGDVFRWKESLCSQMVIGNGPCVAPYSNAVPAYASAPIGRHLTIGAYIGVPLVYENGTLFGTLCAIHPVAQQEVITAELPLLELLANLLSSLLNADLKASEKARLAEQAKTEALSDALTNLYNRRGWDEILAYEEKRCQQYGHPACIIAIDLDGLKLVNDMQGHTKGDELICRASHAIQRKVRKSDVVARVGGDEFVVLCVECDLAGGKALVERIKTSLSLSQVDASLGIAVRQPSQGLAQAWKQADQAMYFSKRERKLLRESL